MNRYIIQNNSDYRKTRRAEKILHTCTMQFSIRNNQFTISMFLNKSRH